jgi:hypothetical protein
MKTLREIEDIERYLLDQLEPQSKLLFEARLLVDPLLKIRVQWQRKIHAIVRRSGRRQLKMEVERIHRQLFADPSRRQFQQKILQLFSK